MNDTRICRGYLPTGLGQVHYRECGFGAPLILLHPAPRSSLVFSRLLDALAAQRGIRAIALDLPGFGMSDDLPPRTSIARLATMVAQVIASFGTARAHVFGLHSGNKVAAALAAEHPDRVDRLVIAGMTHSIILDATHRNEAMREYVRRKPPIDPSADPPAWHDEQLDRLMCRGSEDLYVANYEFDLAASLKRVQNRALILELAVTQELSLGRQGEAICAVMRDATAHTLACNDRELLQERQHEAAMVLKRFYLDA
jgi:pimeloyl-ACP methyl ester carboxylesterase